ncbi:MAG: hypothetical protein PWQ63_786 [Methanolobus sp.]|jgi:hypothetical protein|nr:hypothetical protein [Methanolobus sp.]MDK2947626.1 hypothetical protein [Methanolobus sp.]
MATREIKNGTKINMHFGNTIISGILNDSKPSRELISRLSYIVRASRYDFDRTG